MTAYSKIQQQEFAREKDGYTSVKLEKLVRHTLMLFLIRLVAAKVQRQQCQVQLKKNNSNKNNSSCILVT